MKTERHTHPVVQGCAACQNGVGRRKVDFEVAALLVFGVLVLAAIASFTIISVAIS